MAEILPSNWRELALAGRWSPESDTLAMLQALPEGLTVFHSLGWTQAGADYTRFGEIDFCILNREGRVLVVEQKNGLLEEREGDLVKEYGDARRNVAKQIRRSVEGLQQKFKAARSGQGVLQIDYLFYCPDYRIARLNAVGLDAARIVDARARDRLAARIVEILGNPPSGSGAHYTAVREFLLNRYELVPDVNAFIAGYEAAYSRISGGLARWARRLRFEPFRLRVTGCAGSGKTQLAMAEYRAALARGRRPLLVCFNHPLAQRLRAIAPPGGTITTFHALCEQWVRAFGAAPDFADPDPALWDRLVDWARRLPAPPGLACDTLIVDEGQDLPQEWADLMLRLAGPGARVLWLEDPLQNLYARPGAELPGFVGMEVRLNHRSPKAIQAALDRLLGAEAGIECANPLPGFDLEIHTYRDDEDLCRVTGARIGELIGRGFRRRNIALVSARGMAGSVLARTASLGPFGLRRFTGAYDADGRQCFTPGDIAFETVYRFKGQQAPAVVFAEIDFETFDEAALRRLYCGMTRASLALELVMSERAAAVLIDRLG
jgi:hypothetical protein